MRQLREAIEDSGFVSFYLSLTPGNLRMAQWVVYAKALRGTARTLTDFFLLGEKLELRALKALISEDCADELIAAGIVVVRDEYASMGSFRLLCWEGVLFFAELSFRPAVYYGADSLALNVHHSYWKGCRALDLCAGPGIQALTLARRGFSVDAVELNPAAAAVGRVNVSLNSLEERIVYHQSDAAEFIKAPRNFYDLVVMNPPLLPIAADLAFPFVGDGGEDGQKLTMVVLEHARNLFCGDRSRLVIVGLTPRRRDEVVIVEEQLQRICALKGLRAKLFLLGHHPAEPGGRFFDSYVRALQIYNSELAQPDEVVIRVAEYLRRNRIKSMDQYVVIVSPQGNTSSPQLETNDLGACGFPDWFS
jgi:16S rRNA G966 N2-methylase RsmD